MYWPVLLRPPPPPILFSFPDNVLVYRQFAFCLSAHRRLRPSVVSISGLLSILLQWTFVSKCLCRHLPSLLLGKRRAVELLSYDVRKACISEGSGFWKTMVGNFLDVDVRWSKKANHTQQMNWVTNTCMHLNGKGNRNFPRRATYQQPPEAGLLNSFLGPTCFRLKEPPLCSEKL